MKHVAVLPLLALLLTARPSPAQEPTAPPPCPEPYALCLVKPDEDTVVESLKELNDVKGSKAVLKLKEDIVIVRDWQDRVYINGGSSKPVDATLTIGSTVSREMQIQLPIRVYYRPKPPDPMFRLRLRAQAGILLPMIWKDAKGGWDAGLSFDFFHVGDVNVAAYTGVRSAGGGVGLDLTRNFGPYVGYSLVYDGFASGVLAGAFFSFN
jgi:hypothetical protein